MCQVFVFLCVWFVGGLSAFHMHLIASNQTTYENFRYHLASDGNPYHEGLLRNCYLILCSAIPASRLSLRAHAFSVRRAGISPRLPFSAFRTAASLLYQTENHRGPPVAGNTVHAFYCTRTTVRS